jgi:hypothetical protein
VVSVRQRAWRQRLSVNKKLSRTDFSNIGAKPKSEVKTLISLRGKTKRPLG